MIEAGTLAILANRMAAGSFTTTAWVGMADPAVAELMVRAGFDTAMFDMQHGAVDVASATRGIALVALAGKPSIVRIPVGDFATASRMLDAGAAGIIAPMINCVADAQRLVEFTKFPPLGGRSWGPNRALALSGLDQAAYFATANRLHMAIAMIETREALAIVDDILAIPGIDGVFVGPADLSIALSNGANLDPLRADVDAALTHVATRAKAHSKFASAFCHNGEQAKKLSARGYLLCSVGTDGMVFRQGVAAALAPLQG